MSVFTAATFFVLLVFYPLSLASALPCPECEEGYPPPVVVVTEPCEECEDHPYTPPPVVVTETCHECEEHHPTPHVLTETISVCRRSTPSKSIIPFTSGTHTYLFSSCIPSTMFYTHNITAASITSISTTTSISIRTVFPNNTQVAPVQTAYPNASTITITKPGSAAVQTETLISTSYVPPVRTLKGRRAARTTSKFLLRMNDRSQANGVLAKLLGSRCSAGEIVCWSGSCFYPSCTLNLHKMLTLLSICL